MTPEELPTPREEPLARFQEKTARFLAVGLLVVIGLLVLLPLGWYALSGSSAGSEGESSFKEVGAYVSGVLPAVTTLLGVAVGFYFSEKRHG